MLELALFDEAVSGAMGLVYHGLHWRRLTGVFNHRGFFYRLIRAAIGEILDDEVEFCLP